MVTQTRRGGWGKRILLLVLAAIVVLGALYTYYATEEFEDTSVIKADFVVTANDLIKEFENNDSAANVKYRDKILTVKGTVSAVEKADSVSVNIKMSDTATGSYAIFAFQEQHLQGARSVREGDKIAIKGSFSAGTYSEILGVERIDFKRCALEK